MTFREFLNRDDHLPTLGPKFSGLRLVGKAIKDAVHPAPDRSLHPHPTIKPALPPGVLLGRRFTDRGPVPGKPTEFLPRKTPPVPGTSRR